nr:diguanylate cyclase [Eubacterium sp.]
MKHILVVDDSKTNLAIAKQELSEDYQVTPVISGFQALQFLEKRTTDLILLDINMPEMDGKETLRRVKQNPLWAKIPIIFLTADSTPETESDCLALGADDFIAKPFVPKVMKRRISRIIELNELRYDLETRLEEKTREVELVTIQSIMAIARTIDEKDKYTSGHSSRVAKCSVALAKRLGWSEEECQNLHYVALLHDIGKIGVPDNILNKPSRLTDSEFAIIKKHPVMGNAILKDIKTIAHVNEGALYHHERYDGSGYPCGLKGEEIPITARIVGIADAYDAMTSSRIYRPKLTEEKVIQEFETGSGTQFDPEFCRIFVEMLREGFSLEEDLVVKAAENHEAAKDEAGYLKEIHSILETDQLTGLFNQISIEKQVNQVLQTKKSGAFYLVQLDHLKAINMEKGHIVGDALLKEIADVLKENVGEGDLLSRIKGDQFAIFYPNLETQKEAMNQAKRIFATVLSKMEEKGGGEYSSVSIGISLVEGRRKTFEELLNRADRALYHVLSSGKNGYHVYYDSQAEVINRSTSADLDDIRRYVARMLTSEEQAQMILFTIEERKADAVTLEKAMSMLNTALMDSLRQADDITKYSTSQYVVVLKNVETENAKEIAERILKKFYCINTQEGMALSYDLQTVTLLEE